MPSNKMTGIAYSRSTPGTVGYALTAEMLSDTVDLEDYAKAMSAYNGTEADVTIAFKPTGSDNTLKEVIPAGQRAVIPWSVKRVMVTGSTGLSAGITAETVIVNMVMV